MALFKSLSGIDSKFSPVLYHLGFCLVSDCEFSLRLLEKIKAT